MLTHLINNRILTTFRTLAKELDLCPGKNFLFDLSHLGVLEVQGTNAAEFLQGQLTCDLKSLSDIQMAQGAQCTVQGRILALMDIIQWKGIKLILPKDLLEDTINSLNKAALLSRVSFKKNDQLQVLGFYLQDPLDLIPDINFFPVTVHELAYDVQYCCYYLGHGFYILLAEAEFAQHMLDYFSEKNQICGSLTWHTLGLKRKQITIYPESRGLFLPHRLDLHQTSYLSFNKGCYKGQEIIARMHYKATLKHQLAIYSIKSEEPIYSGQKLLSESSGTEIGELIDLSLLGNGHYLVAISLLKEAEPMVLFEGHKNMTSLVTV
jgi:folate-binding protein YgfZ